MVTEGKVKVAVDAGLPVAADLRDSRRDEKSSTEQEAAQGAVFLRQGMIARASRLGILTHETPASRD